MSGHVINVSPEGTISFICDDSLQPLMDSGNVSRRRASHVEPDDKSGGWTADMSPCDGPTLRPFTLRSEALSAERAWLLKHRFYFSH